MKRRFEHIAGGTAAIVGAVMASEDLPGGESLRFRIRLCVEEIVDNVVSYAYVEGDGFLEVETALTDGLWCVTLKDAGVPFNPLDKAAPDIEAPLADRKIGGLGIFLARKMADSVDYGRKGGCNVITVRFKCQ